MTAPTNQAALLCNMSAPFNRLDFQNNLFPQTFVFFDSSNETQRDFIQNACDFQLCEAIKKGGVANLRNN